MDFLVYVAFILGRQFTIVSYTLQLKLTASIHGYMYHVCSYIRTYMQDHTSQLYFYNYMVILATYVWQLFTMKLQLCVAVKLRPSCDTTTAIPQPYCDTIIAIPQYNYSRTTKQLWLYYNTTTAILQHNCSHTTYRTMAVLQQPYSATTAMLCHNYATLH